MTRLGYGFVLLLVAACAGQEGTISLRVVTACGDDTGCVSVMDQVERARLTLTEPMTVVEASRGDEGELVLAIDVAARNTAGQVIFEGFDASDTLVAYGRTAPLPIAAIEANLALYVAPPLSMAEAPVALSPPRSDMGVTVLPYGALLAGGRYADGEVAKDLEIYNVYAHDFQTGWCIDQVRADDESACAARANLTVMAGLTGAVYLFGGMDGEGQDSAAGWRYDTTVPPGGAYADLLTDGSLARSGARAAPRPNETFVVTGDPLVLIDGLSSRASTYTDAPALEGTATTVSIDDTLHTLFAGAGSGASGAVLLQGEEFVEIDAPAEMLRTGHETVVLPDSTLLVLGGESAAGVLAAGVRVDVRERRAWVEDGLLATPRRGAAIAAAGDVIVVAGGVGAEGQLLGDVEVLDARTLAPVATLAMVVPRKDAHAMALANGQVLIVGGTDAADQPIGVIELFTPGPGVP